LYSDAPQHPAVHETPASRAKAVSARLALLMGMCVAFGICFGVGLFVPGIFFVALAEVSRPLRHLGAIPVLLLVGLAEYHLLGMVVERRKRAELDGKSHSAMAEAALFGYAFATLVTGVCNGVMVAW
jgi:hypothetical protein